MHAWFDISAGVAGDMLLGSLLDAGADPAAVQASIDAVAPGSVRLETEQVVRGGQRGLKARVRVLVEDPPHRRWATIRTTLQDADLHDQTRAWALDAFARLAEAEGRAHGVDPETVYFHEVGALDSLADVVGTCEALRTLGVTSASASPVRLGSGRVRAAHGDIPVPVPAVTELVAGWRTYATPLSAAPSHHPHPHDDHSHEPDVHSHSHSHDHGHGHDDQGHHHGHTHHHDHTDHDHDHPHAPHHDAPAAVTTPGAVGELATPTGMALIRALAQECAALPAMTVRASGIGAGGKDFPGWPNVVRVVLGDLDAAAAETPAQHGHADVPALALVELRANVDDLDPRLWPGVLDALLAAGAADAWLVPIVMKKGRPGFTLHALADADAQPRVTDTMLAGTSTLGVRGTPVSRTVLDRHWLDVDVLGRPIRVKVGSRGGVVVHAEAEFSSLAEAASELGRPEYDVARRAAAAIAARGLLAGEPLPPGLA